MTDRAILALLAHLEAKQMASDFLLEVLLGSHLSGYPAEQRDEQITKIAMLARERTTISPNSTADEREYLQALLPDFVEHVDRLCRRISARADDTGL